MNPLHAPPEASVLWLVQEDTSAVILSEAPPTFTTSSEQHPEIEAILEFDGEAALLYDLGNGQRIQLVHHGQAQGAGPVAALVPLSFEGFDRLESISRLLSALHGRAIPPDTRLTKQQRTRLRRMLQCFDGHRHGATQQEIAQVVFRVGPLHRDDWQASSVRHTIKSMLRDAHAMVAGGYLALLRHRRRS